jgi:hypothetical protein
MRNAARGKYKVRNPEKYMGLGEPTYRSSWEMTFMMFCDNNPSVQQWASESVKIPYQDPLTGKQTIYVPDFMVVYVDRDMKKHAELIEIKPKNQAVLEAVGKNKLNQAQYVKNMAKWQAAQSWCKRFGLKFRIVSEDDIFHSGSKKR